MNNALTRIVDFAYDPTVRWWAARTLLPLIALWLLMMLLGVRVLTSTEYTPGSEGYSYGAFGTKYVPATYASTTCRYWTGVKMYEKEWKSEGACPLIVLRAQEPNE
ncbi:hypothetical protein ASF00_09245 [Sphingomonas sp. Leaf34]|uniref:hypothetical protein n=1 Tax=Sphingomonas sp. Leaf34 TaxID=1736216 RepID=UPI0006F63E05|nr:hypothetical protein [Sphingomonas sp. Leaf34]KQN28083.1 hypothetical protein ASF00_09245 [Sphingomonas sp. Leaf34]